MIRKIPNKYGCLEGLPGKSLFPLKGGSRITFAMHKPGHQSGILVSDAQRETQTASLVARRNQDQL